MKKGRHKTVRNKRHRPRGSPIYKTEEEFMGEIIGENWISLGEEREILGLEEGEDTYYYQPRRKEG